LPDSVFHITASPAESVATRFGVTSIRWTRGSALSITARSPVELAAFGPSPVAMSIGEVPGSVTITSDKAASDIVVRFPVTSIISDARRLGDRREVRLRLDLHGETCDVPLRMPADLQVSKRLRVRGYRTFGVGPAKNKDGHLVVDTVPLTMSRVLRRLRKSR
jgi:hypothetical protein